MEAQQPAPRSPEPGDDAGETAPASRFALTEDWLATIVGLLIIVLAMLGVITEGWLPL